MQFNPQRDVWRLVRRDVYALLLFLLGVALFSWLLYRNFSIDLEASGDAERVGTLIIKRNVAQRKFSKQVFWEPASNYLPLFNRDSVRTGEASSALIQLYGAAEIEIDANTFIILNISRETANIDFSYGSLTTRQSLPGGGGEQEADEGYQLNISTEGQTISAQDSALQLHRNRGEAELSLVVSQGQANIVAESGESQVVAQNERAQLGKGQAKVEKIRLVPQIPEDGERFFVAKGREQELTFQWQAEKGIGQVDLEISRERDFSQLSLQRRVAGGSTELSLPAGVYYWRLSGVASARREYSPIGRFSIIASSPVVLHKPEIGASIEYLEEEPLILFVWEASQTASSYLLEVAADRNFNDISLSRSSSGTAIAARLPSGSYFWRVSSRSGIKGAEQQSAVSRFRVDQLADLGPPLLRRPQIGLRLSVLALQNRGLTFNWESSPEVQESQISIAQDRDFEEIILLERVTRNWFKLRRSLDPGRYYWRVNGLRRKTAFSSIGSFTVLEQSPLSVAALVPADQAAFRLDRELAFRWKQPEMEGPFEILVANDRNFNSVLLRRIVTGHSLEDVSLRPGSYYWVVRLLDSNGENLAVSKSSSFEVIAQSEILRLRSGEEVEGIITGTKDEQFYIKSENGLRRIPRGEVDSIFFR